MSRCFVCVLFLASSALGQSLLATVPEFDYPQAMAVNTWTLMQIGARWPAFQKLTSDRIA